MFSVLLMIIIFCVILEPVCTPIHGIVMKITHKINMEVFNCNANQNSKHCTVISYFKKPNIENAKIKHSEFSTNEIYVNEINKIILE